MIQDIQKSKLTLAEKVQALSKDSTALLREREFTSLYNVIVRSAIELTLATTSALYLYSSNENDQAQLPATKESLHLALTMNTTPEQEAYFYKIVQQDDEMFSPIFKQGIPILVGDITSYILTQVKDVERNASLNKKVHLRSFSGTPLHNDKGEVRGVLLLGHSEPNHFTEEDQMLLRILANQATVALENFNLHTRIQATAEKADHAQARTNYLEATFEAMVDSVFVYDQQAKIMQMNEAARAMIAKIELPDAQALSSAQRLSDLVATSVTGQRLTPDQLPITRMLKGEQYLPEHAFEFCLMTQDGETLHVCVTGGPIHDLSGQIVGAIAIARDISENKNIEQQREQQNQQLLLQARLIEHAHDAIIVRDPHSAIISWNLGAEALYGWTAEEAKGQIIHTLLQTHFPRSKEVMEHLLETDGRWEGELVHTCRDGRKVIVESRRVLMRDEAGKTSAILEINRDVSTQRHLEYLERTARAEAESRLTLLQQMLNELPR